MEQVAPQQCKWISHDKTSKCNRPLYDQSGYCLFHKPDKQGVDAELFMKVINFNVFSTRMIEITNRVCSSQDDLKRMAIREMDEELNRLYLSNFSEVEKARADFPVYQQRVIDLYHQSAISGTAQASPNFRGFVFPTMERQFRYTYNPFSMSPTLDFSDAIFEGCANFSGFHFIGNVTFKNTAFRYWVIFANSIFDKHASFIDTDLNTAYLYGYAGMFENTAFLGSEVIFKNVKGNLSFSTAKFAPHTRLRLDYMQFPKKPGNASYGENAYRVAKVQANAVGDYARAGDYYYQERVYKRIQLNWKVKPIDWLMGAVTGYGEKPIRIVVASVFVILFFAAFYFVAFYYSAVKISSSNAIYYSATTFSTLGLGMPDCFINYMKWVLPLEALIGGIFMALLVLTLSKRYSRG